jgi:hypothetical protein
VLPPDTMAILSSETGTAEKMSKSKTPPVV